MHVVLCVCVHPLSYVHMGNLALCLFLTSESSQSLAETDSGESATILSQIVYSELIVIMSLVRNSSVKSPFSL